MMKMGWHKWYWWCIGDKVWWWQRRWRRCDNGVGGEHGIGTNNSCGPDTKDSPEIVEAISSWRVRTVTTVWGVVVVADSGWRKYQHRAGGGASKTEKQADLLGTRLSWAVSECSLDLSSAVAVARRADGATVRQEEAVTVTKRTRGITMVRRTREETVVKQVEGATMANGENEGLVTEPKLNRILVKYGSWNIIFDENVLNIIQIFLIVEISQISEHYINIFYFSIPAMLTPLNLFSVRYVLKKKKLNGLNSFNDIETRELFSNKRVGTKERVGQAGLWILASLILLLSLILVWNI